MSTNATNAFFTKEVLLSKSGKEYTLYSVKENDNNCKKEKLTTLLRRITDVSFSARPRYTGNENIVETAIGRSTKEVLSKLDELSGTDNSRVEEYDVLKEIRESTSMNDLVEVLNALYSTKYSFTYDNKGDVVIAKLFSKMDSLNPELSIIDFSCKNYEVFKESLSSFISLIYKNYKNTSASKVINRLYLFV